MKSLPYIIFLFLFVCCKSKEEEKMESLNKTLDTYLRQKLKDLDSTANLDSLRIVVIDTVSTKDDFMLMMLRVSDSLDNAISDVNLTNEKFRLANEQFKTLQYMNNLANSDSDLSIFKDDVLEKKSDAQRNIDYMNELLNRLDSLRKMYGSGKLDSTNFLYYGVIYKVCYSDKKLVQKCIDNGYLNINKDYRVIEN